MRIRKNKPRTTIKIFTIRKKMKKAAEVTV